MSKLEKKFFNPSWYQINKSIDAGQAREIRKELRELEKKIDDKILAYYKLKSEAERIEKVTTLKNLPAGAEVFYKGNFDKIPFGAKGKKVKDGRVRMRVEFDGKQWLCGYGNLKIEETTSEEKSSHVITNRLSNFLTNNLTAAL